MLVALVIVSAAVCGPVGVVIDWDSPSEATVDATVEGLTLQVDQYFHNGYYENAIRALFASVALDPGFEEAYENAAWLVWSLGDMDDADQVLKWGIASNPDSGRLHAELGMHCFRTQRYQDALSWLLRSVELEPNARTQLSVGHTYRKLGQDRKALEAYKKALEIAPDDPAAKFNVELLSRELAQKQDTRHN